MVDHQASVVALPIESAPIKPGEEFGPCLLWAPEAANYPQCTLWVIGDWNGKEWCDQEGILCRPAYWSPLPRNPGFSSPPDLPPKRR